MKKLEIFLMLLLSDIPVSPSTTLVLVVGYQKSAVCVEPSRNLEVLTVWHIFGTFKA
jgi:hypothetical protein